MHMFVYVIIVYVLDIGVYSLSGFLSFWPFIVVFIVFRTGFPLFLVQLRVLSLDVLGLFIKLIWN